MQHNDAMDARNDLPALGVRRPWLVAVMNMLIAIAGLAALLAVEVRELPDVDRPIINVRAQLPGGSPETMDAEVTRVLEGAVARVSGVTDIRSSSEENSTRIRAEFRPGYDLDRAATDVREAISQTARNLPDDVEQLAVYKADEDAEEVVRVAVLSTRYNEETLTRIVEQDIVPAFLALPGVADVPLFGSRKRTLRVILDPLRLTSYGLTVSDVAAVLREAPLDVPAGSFRGGDQQLLVRADASVVTEEQVANTIVTGTVRIGDVADVAFAPADAESIVRLNGQRVVGIGVVRQAGSNTIEIAAGADRAIAELNARFDDLTLQKISDNAIFIRGAVKEVLLSLFLAVMVVVATIRVFSGSWRLTLVPAIAIPVSLLGTVGAIWVLGFSINILTLLALVLATGLIVDDAIVVLENVQRRRRQGLGANAAAVLGTRQVFFAVIATTVVLVAVFVPIAFLPGTAGRLFREFGLVLAVAVAISSFVALSLVPAAMARLGDSTEGAFDRKMRKTGTHLQNFYIRSLNKVLAHPWSVLVLCLLAAAGSGALYLQLDQELLPSEDRGEINIFARGPDGVGLPYMGRQADRMEDVLLPLVKSGEIKSLYTVVGRYDPNLVFISAPLADWDERARSQQEIAAEIAPILRNLPGAGPRVYSGNSLNLRGASGGLKIVLTGNDYGRIYAAARDYADAIRERLQSVSGPRVGYQPTQPQLSVRIDRRRLADLGVSLPELAETLRAMIDGLDVIDLNIEDQAVPIMLESGARAVNDPGDLTNLYVRAGSGALVPLSSVVEIVEEGVASELERQSQRRAIEVDVDVAQGVAMQTAVDELRDLAMEVIPEDIEVLTRGEAATLEESNRETLLTYGFALLIVFLVLVAQFESLTSAIVIIAVVPFGLAAAILALFLTGTSLNIYSQVGLVMLIGLIAKNGILLVEFADQLRDEGRKVRDAVAEAAAVRLRPIAMTLVSTVLGALPLIISSGPGAEARSAVGWVVFGGLGLTALFTLYLTPVLYLGVARFARPRSHAAQALDAEMRDAMQLSEES
ncbi:efflux RND transporter permease subunit [Congregibacter variabilis]|uniref:Efflux RND transporter permease subunit n=1 Tax=Congregibacter variabilis TaxID=3081200 RepID=A0ABZ0I6G2_9GAMM|nr:efflux RND transporter permease subunit [Congregibacter sp. IMCC43200]